MMTTLIMHHKDYHTNFWTCQARLHQSSLHLRHVWHALLRTAFSVSVLTVMPVLHAFAQTSTQQAPRVTTLIDTAFAQRSMPYAVYLSLVGKRNLAYVSMKYNLNIAQAAIEMAKVLPDPEIAVGWFDNDHQRTQMGYGFASALSWTLELGGKRQARIDLAQSTAQLTSYMVQDYFRNLRADATLSYLQALKNTFLLRVALSSYESMLRIAQADSVRAQLGSITDIDAQQSKLEAGTLLNDAFQAQADAQTSLAELAVFIGAQQSDTLVAPEGDFSGFDRSFTLQELIITAQNNRADLLAALQNSEVATKFLALTEANRTLDIGLNVGVNHAGYVSNIIAPTPSFTTLSAGLSIPLKFSNQYTGDLQTAHYAKQQADAQYRQIELQIQSEVTKAYFSYIAAQKQVQQYRTGLLSEAKAVLEGKIYSYQRGATTLLEVLNAQRTYNDVQQQYYNVLNNYAAALVELERAAGIWDINF